MNSKVMYENTIFEQLEGQRGVGCGDNIGWFYPIPENKNVTELCFGQGELIRTLLKNKNKVSGFDAGKASIDAAYEEGWGKEANIHYSDISMSKLPLENDSQDCIFLLEAIEHLENPAHVFSEAKRVLKHNGDFIIAFPRPCDNIGYSSGLHAHMYPGFLLKHSFRMFCDQHFFKLVKYAEDGSTAYNWLKNIKDRPMLGIHEIIQGNYDRDKLFGHLHDEEAWNEEKDAPYVYKVHQSINLFRGINYQKVNEGPLYKVLD